MCVCVGANSAPQELPTMKTRRKRVDLPFPIAEKLVDFPALNAYTHYILCAYSLMIYAAVRYDDSTST